MENREGHGNRLSDELSPYLRLHADNPVAWYPWCDAALAHARSEHKPIFLSVGYSSCHWCHVMARESFQDQDIAAQLNASFVSIKVDREERPDIDAIYMAALQIMTRQGGWPMSMFLTPDARPFFGATYLPARDGDRPGAMGFSTLLERVREVWQRAPEQVSTQAAQIVEHVAMQLEPSAIPAHSPVGSPNLDAAAQAMADNFDRRWGGFGYSEAQSQRPKFPEPSGLLFLLRRLQQGVGTQPDQQRDRTMLMVTLDRMAAGGIRDHLGGGFHRYSVDRFWAVPHFEKMLYDNGQLATLYAEAGALLENPEYHQVVVELVEFVQREMTNEGGAFHAALDAESEREEGKYYRWEKSEIETLAGADYELFAAAYGLNEPPNLDGRYHVLCRTATWPDLAQQFDAEPQQVACRLADVRSQLLAARARRVRPRTDDKVVTAWNGLMIRGLADAGRLLRRTDWIESAAAAADFIRRRVVDAQGRLLRCYARGQARQPAFLTDYAFIVNGLLALFRATGDDTWLREAARLTDVQIERYWDAENGGFQFVANDQPPLIVNIKNLMDGAQPSGNAVAAESLFVLAAEFPSRDYRTYAERTVALASSVLVRAPTAALRMAAVAQQYL